MTKSRRRSAAKPTFQASRRPGARAFEAWCRAMDWQVAVDKALAPLELNHLQYWLLSTTAQLKHETEDAVSQQEIADAAHVHKMTVSRVARALELRGLLDRGPSFGNQNAWRILVTARGYRLLAAADPLVKQVAASFSED